MAEYMPLTDGWSLRPLGGEIPEPTAAALAAHPDGVPATVPGCVHTDLRAAGVIPDPYLDRNEQELGWIGRTDWRYQTSLRWRPAGYERVDLVCEGLDTVATLYLGDAELGTTANQHRSYRFPITHALAEGNRLLTIDFASAERYAAAQRDRLGDLPGPAEPMPGPFNFVRKMACNFGWDWGPILTTAGIWRPISWQAWSIARLAQVRPHVEVEGATGTVRVEAELERTETVRPVELVATVEGYGVQRRRSVQVDDATHTVVVELDVNDVRRWWPHSYGDQPLYDLTVELRSQEQQLDHWQRRIGFRSVRLDTSADDIGSAFTVVVNDVPIFARGANWIPDDCFPSRVDTERYRRRIGQAKAANIDLLRVWGGGIYEADDFYAACDEAGVLVWQDFCFACAAYPEEPPFAEEVEAEARDNVVRLMPHPSLALWNGNNENIWGYQDWGWQEVIGRRSWGAGYYYDLLPSVVAELDPTRPYWPGSPYAGTPELHPNVDEHGCSHIWDVWNSRDYTGYLDYVPRFVAEFGYQAPATWATLQRAVHDDPLTPDSPGMRNHQRAPGGQDKLERGLAVHFGVPDRIEDWHYLTQVNQARALTLGIEHFRAHRGRCMGTVIWQLNDCWPVISWAAVDGDGRCKPLWYALRRAYAPRLITVQRREQGLSVTLVNDTATPWSSDLEIQRRGIDGAVVASTIAEPESVDGRSTTTRLIPDEVATTSTPDRELLVAMFGGQRAEWFFVEDRRFAYPAPDYACSVVDVPGGADITVAARTLLRDLAVFPDVLAPQATVDEQLVTLLPSETVTFAVRGLTESLDRAALDDPRVLRSVGGVVGPS